MQNRTIFITGASSGFGAACAAMFASAGERLILAARRIEPLMEMREKFKGRCETHLIRLDVRDREAVRDAIDSLPRDFAEIDILVNNAGLALGLEPAYKVSMDDWETMIDTNIKGVVYCTRNILPGMVSRNRGHIVNIGSTAGEWPYPGGNVYGATKAFVTQFSRNLRCDLLGTSVRVTCIEPGMAETEFSRVRFRGDKDKAKEVYEGVEPLTAEDIAETVRWVSGLPEHVNINTIEMMSIDQAWGPYAVNRRKKG